ncbi:methyl-accepting chemotaxis protein [Halorarum salinum]|uniref:PAS domain-containing protein n=1 Tax=Halorarum salinum TaxID=2743089 RepID=A0A7D5LB44_9EURY|nr:methyl-accepting chemotaxis protein [Halobaculum salinum]QLG62311.1 PAS domain-containing protein [Halobaculum salinum]
MSETDDAPAERGPVDGAEGVHGEHDEPAGDAGGAEGVGGAERLAEAYLDRIEPDDRAERDRAEAAFWRELFDGLVAALPESALVVDDGGTITHWNEAHSEMVGIAEAEAVGNNAHEVLGTEGAEETLAEEVVRVGETIAEDAIREIPASDKALQVYAVPLDAPDGEPVGAFSVAADVTDHVRRQRDLERLQSRVSGAVRERTADLADAVEEVAEFTDDADQFAAEQAERMREVADEMTEQSATVQEIAASAEQVTVASDRTRSLVEDGDEAATEATEAMGSVEGAAEEVAGAVDDLTDRADEVGEVVELIDGIAEQTNMLALNASIEAARAGEAGEGFAVVADEVKSLAEESREHAERIETLVGDMQDRTHETARLLDATTGEVAAAIERIEGVTESLSDVSAAVEETADGAAGVADATDDQAASAEEVAAMVESSVEAIETLEGRLEAVAETAAEGRRQVREVEASVDELREE